MTTKSELRWLGAVLLLALGLRLLAFWLTQETPFAGDERDYFARAAGFARGGGISPIGGRPPAMEVVFGSAFRVFGTSPDVARLVNAVIGSLAVVPLYAVGRRLGGVGCARVAACIAAGYPSFVAFAVGLWSEPLYIAVAMTGLAFLLSGLPVTARALAGGVCLGASVLVRESGLAVPLAAAAWWLFFQEGAWSRRVRAPALLLAGVAVVVVPWTIHINASGQPFALVGRTTWQNLYIGNAPAAERLGADGEVERVEPRLHYYELGEGRLESEAAARMLALDAIAARMPTWPFEKLASELPAFFAPTSFTQQRLLTRPESRRGEWAYRFRIGAIEGRTFRVWAAVIVALVYAGVAIAGTAGLLLALPGRGPALLLFFVAAQLAPCVLAFASSRFRLPGMTALAVGVGLLWVHRRRPGEAGWPRTLALVGAAVVAALLAWQAPTALSPLWG